MKRTAAVLLFLTVFAANCSSGDTKTTTNPSSAETSAATSTPLTDEPATTVAAANDPSRTTETTADARTQAPETTSVADELTAADLFVPDPVIGLAALTSYHQEMTLTVTGSEADTADAYVRDSWAGVGTSTSISMTTPAGVTELLVGDLGQTTYRRSGAGAACEVHWSEGRIPAAPAIEPAAMLPRVVTATETGKDVREGLAATGYRFDAVIGDATGAGELWLADDTGMILSYSFDMVDGAATHSYRYAVTSINTLGEAVLPAGCAPVLESFPAIDGATNVQRLTNGLDYSTTATVADVVAFYEQTMPTLGWALVGTRSDDPAQPTMFFENTTTQQAASIFVEIADGQTWVSAIVRAAAAPAG